MNITSEQAKRIEAIRAGKRPGGLSDTEWAWVREHSVEAVTK